MRARWPHSIVTWNRVLAGRWGDAQVGSDILLGAARGLGDMGRVQDAGFLLYGSGEPINMDISLYSTMGTRQWIGAPRGILGIALRLGIVAFLAVFGLRRILRFDGWRCWPRPCCSQ